MTRDEEKELAYALTDLGDAMASLHRKIYKAAEIRVVSAAKRLRFLLGVQGKEESRG